MITRTASWLQQNGAKIFMKLKLLLSLLRRSVTFFRGGAQHGNFWFQFNFCQISKKKIILKNQSTDPLVNSYPLTILLTLIFEAVRTFEGGKISAVFSFLYKP